MIKILHTSDWHLGHALYNYDRAEEQEDMLRQITEIVRTHKPDVLLVCGDIYHTPQPSAAVQTMFTQAIVKMHLAAPEMTIVITAGNHDSGSRHVIFQTPWRALNVHVIGNIIKENLQQHIISIQGKGYIIAVPHSHERNLPDDFFQQLLDITAEKNTLGLPVIMTAHTTVQGCDFTGHDNVTEHSVGGIDTFTLEEMGTGYDYLALGHIHHAQFVKGGNGRVRYSGTPLAVSFDESFEHSVSLVEIESHGDEPKVETIEIINPHPLVTLPASGMADWDKAKELLACYSAEIQSYIRLNVEMEDFLPPTANSDAQALTANKNCRFCLINAKRKVLPGTRSNTLTVREFQEQEPIDLARRYAKDIGIEFDKEMTDMFKTALEELSRTEMINQ